jgi:hypothetical protein
MPRPAIGPIWTAIGTPLTRITGGIPYHWAITCDITLVAAYLAPGGLGTRTMPCPETFDAGCLA